MELDDRVKLTAQMAATIYSGYLADPNVSASKELRIKCCEEAIDMAAYIDLGFAR